MVCEMQNKGNVCVGVCACVCVILYTKTAVARNAVVISLCKAVWYEHCNANITRKYEKLCIVAFNRKLDYDDVTKLSN